MQKTRAKKGKRVPKREKRDINYHYRTYYQSRGAEYFSGPYAGEMGGLVVVERDILPPLKKGLNKRFPSRRVPMDGEVRPGVRVFIFRRDRRTSASSFEIPKEDLPRVIKLLQKFL